MRAWFTVISLLLWSINARAVKYHYSYTDNCRNAYTYFLALQPEKGNVYIKKEFVEDPYNLMATYLADYDDCLTILFSSSKAEYEQRKSHMAERIKLLERGDASSPWYRLCKAGVYMHWAFVQVRFAENLKSATNFRKSFLLLKENKKLFPDFEYNDIFFGIEESAVGAMPDDYKWIASIFGMKGNVKNGARLIQSFIDKHEPGDPFYREALIYNVYLHFFILSDKEKAWQLTGRKEFQTDNNLLNSFVRANIALNCKKAKEAQKVLQDATKVKEYKTYPLFEYQYAYALYHQLDNRAGKYFTSFLSRTQGDMFVKDSWQKLAYIHYLNNDVQKANECRKKVLLVGGTNAEADKQAQRFAERNVWPDRLLLKVQLLSDGGDFVKAYNILQSIEEEKITNTAIKLEYYYRAGKLNEELKNREVAIKYYNAAIAIGKSRQEQFASRAALQLGLLYEKEGATAKALSMYDLALSMKDHDFKTSIDQQSKAGINRLKK